MTTFVALPDVHSKTNLLHGLSDDLRAADAVLLPGDMTCGSMSHLVHLMDVIHGYNENIFAVPGNMDTVAMLAHLSEYGMNVHRTHVILDEIAICGVGGALPFYGKFVFSEEELTQFLDECIVDVPEGMPKILLCHQPPFDTINDVIDSKKHVGSKSVRAFIEREQPLICFTGHIHEATGIDHIGATKIINPGMIARNHSYAWAEIKNGAVTALEIRHL
ncbi:MAG: metallophosphoesterase [Aggregatilineales bacterium]